MPTRGSAYVFVRSGTTWSQHAHDTRRRRRRRRQLSAVRTRRDGETVDEGARGHDAGTAATADRPCAVGSRGTAWSRIGRRTAGDGQATDNFGCRPRSRAAPPWSAVPTARDAGDESIEARPSVFGGVMAPARAHGGRVAARVWSSSRTPDPPLDGRDRRGHLPGASLQRHATDPGRGRASPSSTGTSARRWPTRSQARQEGARGPRGGAGAWSATPWPRCAPAARFFGRIPNRKRVTDQRRTPS